MKSLPGDIKSQLYIKEK